MIYYFILFLTLLIPATVSCLIFAVLMTRPFSRLTVQRTYYSLLTLIFAQAFLFWIGGKVDGWVNLLLVQILSPAGLLIMPLIKGHLKSDKISVIIIISFSTLIVMALSTFYRLKQ